MNDSKRVGIPTVYAHTQFRSRIEARWASFFDLVGWPWTYEPIDLPGWIPDFSLDWPKPMLVEVKGDVLDTPRAREKIRAAQPSTSVMLLSPYFTESHDECYPTPQIEVLCRVPTYYPMHGPVAPGRFRWSCGGCHGEPYKYISWAANLTNCTCGVGVVVACQADDECERCGREKSRNWLDPTPIWREAGNAVQWRKP